MIRFALAAVVAALFALPACGGDDDPGACGDAGATKEWGLECSNDCECASDLCFTYGDGTSACTIECTTDDDCPEGSQGRKCNGQGVCRA